MDDIKNWLDSSRDYDSGVTLYDKYGNSAVLKGVFAMGPTPYNRKKLEDSLQLIVDSWSVNDALRQAQGDFRPFGKLNVKDVDSVEQGFKDRMRPLFQEGSYLHKRLSDDITMEERRVAAFRILEIFEEELPRIYSERDYYREHGKVRDLDAENRALRQAKGGYETDPMKMMKRMNNLRTYISKYKDKGSRAEDVANWRDELAYYEGMIG